MKKRNLVISIIINAVIFISTSIMAVYGIMFGAISSQPGEQIIGAGYFKPFTMDSNIFAIAMSLFVCIFGIKSLIKKKNCTPKWVVIMHLMNTVCLALTFWVSLLFLAPMKVIHGHSFFEIYAGELISFHLLNPILSFVSFLILEKNGDLKKSDTLLGTLPTFAYATIYLLMVVVLKKWEDFYNFTFDGNYYVVPFVFIFINVIAYGIARLIVLARKKACSKI